MMGGLEAYELRLIRCFLGGSRNADASHAGDERTEISRFAEADDCIDGTGNFEEGIREVVAFIENGFYAKALASKWVSTLFGDLPKFDISGTNGKDGAKFFYEFVESKVAGTWTSEIDGATTDEGGDHRAVLILSLGVAALCAFVQANMTGPTDQKLSCSPFTSVLEGCGAPLGYFDKEWDSWARSQLMIDGCDLIGKFDLPQYLILAKLLLVNPAERMVKTQESRRNGPKTWSWWGLRALMMQQRVLAERSPSILSLCITFSKEISEKFGTHEAVQQLGWNLRSQEAKNLTAAVHLEVGFMEHLYGHNDAARESFDKAGGACGLEFEITGVLGYRTKYQEEAKAQMVLLKKTVPTEEDTWLDFLDGVEVKHQEPESDVENSEIHLVPKLLESKDSTQSDNLQSVDKKGLNSIEQAVVLAWCVDVKKSNPEDELRSWQMAPYIEAIDEQQRSPFMVKVWCQLLRIRWEATRTRTRERAFLMMEKLTDDMRRGDLKVSQRMLYAFCVPFPILTALLKEYAEMMVRFGIVGDALRLFEELEMWNSLIDCYCLLGKKAAAADLIRERLKVQPEEPRLWCSLGDVIMDDECYNKAWEFSGHHFARAQRSLARTAYHKHNYMKSIEHWDLALSLNPLHPDGWFALGSAATKAKDLDKAIHAFTRQVQLDPENGESWNNIAAINMQKKRSKEAFAAFREALKLKRNSWQMWENFAQVSLDVANFSQAILALEKVLDLSEEKRVDIIAYRRLMKELEIRKGLLVRPKTNSFKDTDENRDAEDEFDSLSSLGLPSPAVAFSSKENLPEGDTQELSPSESDSGSLVSSKETDMLLEKTGKLLSRIVARGQGGGEVWGLKARWHQIMGDMDMCVEALLKQVRAYQGSKWQSSEENFEKFARVSLQLCEAYLEMALSGSGKRELSAAHMLLRNTIKQAEPFNNTQQFKDLESCLLKVKSLMQAI
ncbi:tetratricopeptide repeat protein 27 [Marchantia polymorpha subsp. ruderalis]